MDRLFLGHRILQYRTGLLFDLCIAIFWLYCFIRNVGAHALPFAPRKTTNSRSFNQPKKWNLFIFFRVQDPFLFFTFFEVISQKGTFWTAYQELPKQVPPWNTRYALYVCHQWCTQVCSGAGTCTGMTSLPVPDTSVSSVGHQYRYRTLR